MKDLITSIASIMLIMVFVLQFVTNQVTYTRLTAAGSSVKQFEHSAEEKGEITDTDVSSLKANLAYVMDCMPEEIQVRVSESERGNSEYVVQTPLKNIIGAANLLGISREENRADYRFTGVVLTESKGEENEESDHEHGSDDPFLPAD